MSIGYSRNLKVAALLLLSFVSLQGWGQTWKRQTFAPGFSIHTPAKLVLHDHPQQSPNQSLWVYRGGKFGIAMGKHSGKPSDTRAPAKMLREFRAGFGDSMPTSMIIREKNITLQGFPGLEVEYVAQEGVHGLTQVFAAGGKMYTAAIVWPEHKKRPVSAIKRILGSLRLPS